ncbi:unnamed protein product, partial [marine sediment metagenome]
GVRLRPRSVIRAFENDLNALENYMYAVVLNPQVFASLQKKYGIPKQALEEIVETAKDHIEAVKLTKPWSEKSVSEKPAGITAHVNVIRI